jgi:N-acetylmuramoyl-L-alanine amidase
MKRKILACVLILISIFAFWASASFAFSYFGRANSLSTAYFTLGTSVRSLLLKYANAPQNGGVKILIVAGHEPNAGGAIYKNLKERDMNLSLATKLRDYLSQNPRFEVVMARDKNGWNPVLEKYIYKNEADIENWIIDMKNQMSQLVKNGTIKLIDPAVYHAKANAHATLFLFGINRWAAENKFDITIHIHFNDNPKYKGKPVYQGFSIYVPERQYSNSISSKVLAQNLFEEISKIQKTSTMPGEDSGIIEDQDLIAIGKYNTSDTLSVLIEYAYIYEKNLQDKNARNIFIEKAASSTAKAVNDFFQSRLVFSDI